MIHRNSSTNNCTQNRHDARKTREKATGGISGEQKRYAFRGKKRLWVIAMAAVFVLSAAGGYWAGTKGTSLSGDRQDFASISQPEPAALPARERQQNHQNSPQVILLGKTSAATNTKAQKVTLENLTFEVPGYYEEVTDNNSGIEDNLLGEGESGVEKVFTYVDDDGGSIIWWVSLPAENYSREEFTTYLRKSGNRLGKSLLRKMDSDHKMQLSATKEVTYKGMHGRTYHYTGTLEDLPSSFDMNGYLDEENKQAYFLMFLKLGKPSRDVTDDYNTMVKNAVLDGGKTSSANSGTNSKKSSESSSSSKSGSSGKKKASSGVNPQVKAALDSYEKLMNRYCDFMERYENASTYEALEMLSDYYDMLEEYAEALEELDELDTDEFSSADLAYYLEVTGRVTQRLAQVGQ